MYNRLEIVMVSNSFVDPCRSASHWVNNSKLCNGLHKISNFYVLDSKHEYAGTGNKNC
jgi:hypothetical protein